VERVGAGLGIGGIEGRLRVADKMDGLGHRPSRSWPGEAAKRGG
jgi:hypothetical protein